MVSTTAHSGGITEATSFLVGVVCSRTRLDGLVTGWVSRDGADATRQMIDPVQNSQFREHVNAVPLSGISGSGAVGQRLWVQRAGLAREQARKLVRVITLHGTIPEPLPLAHLIAGGVVSGHSRGRA